MLLTLMFHQVVRPGNLTDLKNFRTFLQDLQQHYHFRVPGQKLTSGLNICLTFDDAYFDFYHYIYPLLKASNIAAVLAVPVALIQETTSVPNTQRLAINYPQGMHSNQQKYCPLCTWEEIKTMVQSGLVAPASHTLTHPDLTHVNDEQLLEETCQSKKVLQDKLDCAVDTFVYPYGKTNTLVQQRIARHYRYIMRIGSAVNMNNWQEQQLIYRINADLWWRRQRMIRLTKLLPAIAKYYLNRWRGK